MCLGRNKEYISVAATDGAAAGPKKLCVGVSYDGRRPDALRSLLPCTIPLATLPGFSCLTAIMMQ